MQIYVVLIDTGSYDSWERNIIRAYSDKTRAMKYVNRKNEQLKKFKNFPNKIMNRFYKTWRGNNLKYLISVNGYEFEEVRMW